MQGVLVQDCGGFICKNVPNGSFSHTSSQCSWGALQLQRHAAAVTDARVRGGGAIFGSGAHWDWRT